LQTAAIAPDGSRVVIADGYDLYSWDIVSGAGDPVFEDREMQWFVIFTPDSKFVLSGARGKVNLWDLASHQKIYEFDTAKTSYVQTIAVSPDGRHFAAIPSSAGQDLQVFRMPASAVRFNPAD
jgi:WD40 repeat protein